MHKASVKSFEIKSGEIWISEILMAVKNMLNCRENQSFVSHPLLPAQFLLSEHCFWSSLEKSFYASTHSKMNSLQYVNTYAS